MGFQRQVNTTQAPGLPGDFASANPRKTVLAGEGALVAGQGVIGGVLQQGVVVGRFGWLSYQYADSDNAPAVVDNFGTGLPAGLVHRSQEGLISLIGPLSDIATQVLPKGYQITLFDSVDMWVKNDGAAACTVGMKAFASFADGSISFAAAGTTPGGGSGTASSIAAGTFSVVGSVNGNVMTVTTVNSGSLYAGATVSGTNVASGSKIVEQLTSTEVGGALGGKGTYALSIPNQSAASTTISGTYGILTVGGTVTGTFGPGMSISGGSVVAGTKVYQQLTGTTGVAGTYVVDNNTVVGSTTITAQSSIETKWYARSYGAVGEVVKISDTPL